MRDSQGRKRGALTAEECFARASELIAEHGICLFLVDIVHSTSQGWDYHDRQFELLSRYRLRATELFGHAMPENSLAGSYRVDRGFEGVFGDAAWTAIEDPELVWSLIELKDREFPELQLHYGVAADGYSPGIELLR